MNRNCNWQWAIGAWVAALTWGIALGAPPAGAKGDGWIRTVFEEQAQLLERELAQRMLRRPETPQERLPALELEIDLRFLQRLMLAQAATSPTGSDMQIALRLRADILEDARLAIEPMVEKQTGRLTPAQSGAAAQLHQLTFGVPELKQVHDLDDLSRKIGLSVAALVGADPKSLPSMRPRPMVAPATKKATAEPPTPTMLAEEVHRLSVSAGLRQQLLALGTLATGNPPNRDAIAVLEACIDMARGLQYNTGVTPESRVQMEGQLAEALALWLDPRMRDVGKARIAGLSQYRQLLARVGKLKLSPEQVGQLAPVFAYVRDNPEPGAKILGSLEKGLTLKSRFDARPRTPNALPTLQRSVAEIEKQFVAAHATLMSSLADVPRGIASASELETKGDELSRLADLLEKLDRAPASIEQLNAFKPRPAGLLEKKGAQLAVLASNAAASPARADAARYLTDLDRLARHAAELSRLTTGEIPPPIEKRWTGGKLAAVETRWKAIVTEQASLLAAGSPVEDRKLDRLLVAASLIEALKAAATMDANLAENASLENWIDWRLTLDDLKPFLKPYPDALSEAFTAFSTDSAAGLDAWGKAHQRYRGLVSLINRNAGYREQTGNYPPAPAALAAQMMTPLEAQPFALERYAGWCLWLHKSKPEMAEEVFGLLSRRIAE